MCSRKVPTSAKSKILRTLTRSDPLNQRWSSQRWKLHDTPEVLGPTPEQSGRPSRKRASRFQSPSKKMQKGSKRAFLFILLANHIKSPKTEASLHLRTVFVRGTPLERRCPASVMEVLMLTLFSHSNSDHIVRKASSLIHEPGPELGPVREAAALTGDITLAQKGARWKMFSEGPPNIIVI